MSDLRRVSDPAPATRDVPEVFIQWKGTKACLDFYCGCGFHGHFDGFFANALRCTACGAVYVTPHTLPLRRIYPDSADEHEQFLWHHAEEPAE